MSYLGRLTMNFACAECGAPSHTTLMGEAETGEARELPDIPDDVPVTEVEDMDDLLASEFELGDPCPDCGSTTFRMTGISEWKPATH